jgi:hypothetical protein
MATQNRDDAMALYFDKRSGFGMIACGTLLKANRINLRFKKREFNWSAASQERTLLQIYPESTSSSRNLPVLVSLFPF